MNRLRSYYPYAAVIALMLATAQAASASPSRPNVLVMGAPLTPYVTAILGNTGAVQSLMQPGQDMHQFAMAPSQMQALEVADILVVPHLSISPMLERMVKNRPKLKVIELSLLNGAEPLPYLTANPWIDAAKKPDVKKAEEKKTDPLYPKKLPGFDAPAASYTVTDPTTDSTVDPHLWLDPERMAAIALPLANEIGSYSPANKTELQANAKKLALHLRREVMPGMRALLKAKNALPSNSDGPVIPFITYHPSYQYFISRFVLPYHGQITTRPEEYMGAASLDQLLEAAKATRVKCVIAEVKNNLAERVAEASRARIVLLQPEQLPTERNHAPLSWVESDYDRLLYSVAKQFGECL